MQRTGSRDDDASENYLHTMYMHFLLLRSISQRMAIVKPRSHKPEIIFLRQSHEHNTESLVSGIW